MSSGVTRTTTISYGAGTTTITDPVGKATVLAYDTNDRLASITSPAAASGAAQQVVQFAYDGSGNVISVTDGAGQTTTRTFDSMGNVLTETDPLGHVTSNTYGSKNELLTSTASQSNGVIAAYSDLNSSSWAVSNLTVASAGTLNGAAANSYTVVSSSFDAMYTAGTPINNVGTNTYSFDITMQGSGSNTTGQIALYGNSDYWGDDSDSTATIVSGPGTLTRTAGGLWTVTNLTSATRVHIERTYHVNEQVTARVMVGGSSPQAGNALLLASPQVAVGSTTSTAFNPQTRRFVYDASNELIYTISAEGRVSKLSYDGYR